MRYIIYEWSAQDILVPDAHIASKNSCRNGGRWQSSLLTEEEVWYLVRNCDSDSNDLFVWVDQDWRVRDLLHGNDVVLPPDSAKFKYPTRDDEVFSLLVQTDCLIGRSWEYCE